MAFAYNEILDTSRIYWVKWWISKYARGDIKIHVDRTTGARFARTSQEAYDNMLTLYTILSDTDTATYWGRIAGNDIKCKDLIAGTPGAIRDFIIKSKIKPRSSGSDLMPGCGSDVHGTTTICGQGGVDINKLKAKTCLMTNIAGLMGVIEVVSGYNPFFHTQDYLDMQGYYLYAGGKYYNYDPTDQQNYSVTDRYHTANYSLDNIAWTPYEYHNTYTNSGLGDNPMGTEDQMRNCRYGILGLLLPYSCSCYSYGRKYNPNNNTYYVNVTDGDPINYIEQILYDICGLAAWDAGYTTASANSFRNWVAFGLSNGGNDGTWTETDYVDYAGVSKTCRNHNRGLRFNGTTVWDFSHWNGMNTKRDFSSVVCNNNDLVIWDPSYNNFVAYTRDIYNNKRGAYTAAPMQVPSWGNNKVLDLLDYQYLPWWATGTRNKPEAAAVQFINSIDTWGLDYWTPEKIQQAKEAARYWYDRFGGPGDAEGIKFAGKTNYNYTVMNA